MAYADAYPSVLHVKTMNTDEEFRAGGATFSRSMDLAYAYLTLYSHAARARTDRARLLLYRDSGLTQLYATGAWTDLYQATSGAAAAWLGRVLFEFDPPVPVEDGTEYHVAVEVDYTRNGVVNFVAFSYDWPVAVNDNPDALQLEFYGYRRTRY